MSYRIFATLGFSVCVSSGIKAVEGSTAEGLRGYMQRAWNYSSNECIFNVILWLRTEFSKQYGKKTLWGSYAQNDEGVRVSMSA